MTEYKKHNQALELRSQGKSYSQIKGDLGVSKSTLSRWLRGRPLSKESIRQLRDRNELRIERFRETMRGKRFARLNDYYEKEKTALLPLTNKELLIACLFLYWGEGGKSQPGDVSISNTNPEIIRFSLYWLTVILKVPKEKIYVKLHLYKDMDPTSERTYWNRELGVALTQFKNPYIKESARVGRTYKGLYNHGTCNLYVGSTNLKSKIMMSIKVIADHYKLGPVAQW